MAITTLPTPPSRQDPINFADRADAFLGQLPQFGDEANALAADVNAKQTDAAASASAAAASATTAQNAASAASAAASYKGEWSTLTGPLTTPATVSYNNLIYLLLTNVSDVTAHTPGVSSVWLLSGVYDKPVIISTNTNVVPFTNYRVTANCVATLPASPADGTWIKFLNKTGTNNFTVARNGKTIEGSATDLLVNVNHKGFWLVYKASSNDWWIFG